MIVEFAGLPNSGKTTTIGTIRDYFSRTGYNVRVIAEGARICPFSKQNRVELACWAANQVMNTVLEQRYYSAEKTLVLQDRGLFDALGFLVLLELDGQIAREELESFLDYLVNPRWTRLIDLVILFDVSHERAVERDGAARLGARLGSFNHAAVMEKLSFAYDFILKWHGARFVKIERIDTSDIAPLETARRAIQVIQNAVLGEFQQSPG